MQIEANNAINVQRQRTHNGCEKNDQQKTRTRTANATAPKSREKYIKFAQNVFLVGISRARARAHTTNCQIRIRMKMLRIAEKYIYFYMFENFVGREISESRAAHIVMTHMSVFIRNVLFLLCVNIRKENRVLLRMVLAAEMKIGGAG